MTSISTKIKMIDLASYTSSLQRLPIATQRKDGSCSIDNGEVSFMELVSILLCGNIYMYGNYSLFSYFFAKYMTGIVPLFALCTQIFPTYSK